MSEQQSAEVEALRFYAKQRGLGAVLASDGGMIARAALSEIEQAASNDGEKEAVT